MYARIERLKISKSFFDISDWEPIYPNCPNRTQPTQHKSPASRPLRQIGRCGKDVLAIVAIAGLSDRKSDDSSKDEDKVHDHKDGL